jgi:hypothetical protein
LGTSTLSKATTADFNTAVGFNALALSVANGNVGMGYYTIGNGTLAEFNTGLGYAALFTLTSGSQNTAVGTRALYVLTTQSGSVGLGSHAGYRSTENSVLYIDNRDRTTEALTKTNALIYGKFDASPVNQFLTVNGKLNVSGALVLATGSAPTSISSSGVVGELRWDGSAIYVCTSASYWLRSALSTW